VDKGKGKTKQGQRDVRGITNRGKDWAPVGEIQGKNTKKKKRGVHENNSLKEGEKKRKNRTGELKSICGEGVSKRY